MYTETKIIYVIDNLAELIKANGEPYFFNVDKLMNGRLHVNGKGWIDVRLDDEHATENGQTTAEYFATLITDCFWSRKCDNKYIAYCHIKNGQVNVKGILSRIYLQVCDDGSVSCGYCCGQDWDTEVRIIRNVLLNK